MTKVLPTFIFGLCAVTVQAFACQAYAKSAKTAAVMATAAVQSAKAFHPLVQLSGCVHQAQFSNPFGSGACKYITVNGTNYSAAVPSETPLTEIPELKSIPPNLMPTPISPNTYVNAAALTINGPSWNCLGAEVKVTGSVVIHYTQTSQACPAK
jgi:hypothetical protein